MFKRFTITAAVVLALIAPVANAGLIYDFSWSSAGSTSQDPTGSAASASGEFEVDVAAGESFTEADVLDISITVESDDLGTMVFGITDLLVFEGDDAADGSGEIKFDMIAQESMRANNVNEVGCIVPFRGHGRAAKVVIDD